ncbi:hypothetical protein JTB14_031475 [Gonioctena quinquepunctata]|nr:hypothetical protein JTB14_031475 [Gonioctena quinquepunctata]
MTRPWPSDASFWWTRRRHTGFQGYLSQFNFDSGAKRVQNMQTSTCYYVGCPFCLLIDDIQLEHDLQNCFAESIRGIRLKLRGKEHTSWTERESYYDSSEKKTKYRNVHYSGNNTFLEKDFTLIGEGSMQSGRYEYPFSFNLPRTLPSTFEGSYGYVKYYVKANVDIPFAPDYEDERYLNMHSLIDFNEIRGDLQMDPTVYQDEKTLCCCCCASGPITVDVHLEKESFVQGEVAKIKIEVTNLSNENIDEMSLKLLMTTESKSTSPRTHYKYDSELLWSDSNTGVGAHGERTYEFNVEIPRTAVLYNFNQCTLFRQWNSFKIEAVIPGCHSNLEIEPEVKLGHIPIAGPQTQQLYHPEPVIHPFPAAPPPDSQPPSYFADKAPPYPTGPPSFPPPFSNPGFRAPGFTMPPTTDLAEFPALPSKGMPPVPVHRGLSPELCVNSPSAPTKATLAESEDFVLIGGQGRSSEPPPPSYIDAVRVPSVHPPGVYSPGLPGRNDPPK